MKSNFHKWRNFRNVITIGVIYVINLFSLERVIFWRDKYRYNHREGNTVTIMTRNKTGKKWQWRLSFTYVFPPYLRLFFTFFPPICLPPFLLIPQKPRIQGYLILNKTYIYIIEKNFANKYSFDEMRWEVFEKVITNNI